MTILLVVVVVVVVPSRLCVLFLGGEDKSGEV